MSTRFPDIATAQSRGGEWTVREILQQPQVWRDTRARIESLLPKARAFLQPLLTRPDLRIILTGAGSSAYIGRCLLPELLPVLGRRVEAIATTDLVAAPQTLLQADVPTLLVSFARSGQSAESLAATVLADQGVRECHHLIITCNAEGTLHQDHAHQPRSLSVVLPDATHDRSFAMTSSFSSMLLAAALLLLPAAAVDVERLSAAVSGMLAAPPLLPALCTPPPQRVAFLGSGCLAGLAQEAALKVLELTDGEVVAIAETPLGFRHGPKTFVDPHTLVVVFVSEDALAQRYDLDLLAELAADGVAGRVLAVTTRPTGIAELGQVPIPGPVTPLELTLAYLGWAQLFALGCSLALGRKPDNPSRTGAVSRVVKGVTIHQAGGLH